MRLSKIYDLKELDLIRTSKHINKVKGDNRLCFKCENVIQFNEQCITKTYKLPSIEYPITSLQVSYHLNCIEE